MHNGVNRDEIPTAGIIEKLLALLAAVKLIAKQIATPKAATSPTAKNSSSLNDPNVINPMPISGPTIVKMILKDIFSFKNILLFIAESFKGSGPFFYSSGSAFFAKRIMRKSIFTCSVIMYSSWLPIS